MPNDTPTFRTTQKNKEGADLEEVLGIDLRGLATFTLCRTLFVMAQNRAQRLGITGDAGEECALEFVQHMVLPGTRPPRLLSMPFDAQGRVPRAWLHRCADNFARNVRRRWRRLQSHEASWPEWDASGDERHDWDPAGNAADPAAFVLRQELLSHVWTAVSRLTAHQQEVFERHYLQGESVTDLASSLGMTPHATSQCLSNIRKRLRSLLEQQGVDESVAHEYLHETVPTVRLVSLPPAWGSESEQGEQPLRA